MFAKLAIYALAATASAAGVIAKPIAIARDVSPRHSSGSYSFNNWGGLSSMSGFDNFYGSDNFDGSTHFSETVVEEQSTEVVCHSESVEIIQQRLVVLQEMAKRIITEQICDVETQTIVFEQFHASMGTFNDDLRRQSGHQVGYDSSIASHYGDIVSSDGSLSSYDMGFHGTDVGSSYVVPSGSNWNDYSSPSSVSSAYNAALSAYDWSSDI